MFTFWNHLSETYSNVVKAYKKFLTAPVTVVSSERPFLKLKIVKNYLQSGFCQEWLTLFSIISTKNEVARSINSDNLRMILQKSEPEKSNDESTLHADKALFLVLYKIITSQILFL